MIGKAILKSQIIQYVYWDKNNRREIEHLLSRYKATLEYTTEGGWIVRYNNIYKTMCYDTVILFGYKELRFTDVRDFNLKYKRL